MSIMGCVASIRRISGARSEGVGSEERGSLEGG
jgi:hypothetical protein